MPALWATRGHGDAEDVLDEYVSIDDEYGVVLTGSLEELTLAIDRDATAALRASRRRRGRGADPPP